jgi:hypothetical protein|tara:strand:- start:4 stop:234 length:231 start_codon:yes stop_codon:yes gene_type:complete
MTLTKKNITLDNPQGEVVELTAEEITEAEAQAQTAREEYEAEQQAIQNKANLKASAKAKLVAGEALTQEEADTIVL